MTKKVNWASSIYNIRFIPINEGNSMNKIQIKQGYIPQWRSHMRNIQIDVISAEKDFQQIKHKIKNIPENDINLLIKYIQYMISSIKYKNKKENLLKHTYNKYGAIYPL